MIYIIIIIAIFLTDMYTKCRINSKYKIDEKNEIVENKLFIWHRKNTGFIYSLYSGHIKTAAMVSCTISFTAFAVLISLIKTDGRKALKCGLAMALGGAFGNLYERFFKKGVTDFIFVNIKNAPIFNVADVFIVLGNLIILVSSFFRKSI